MPLSCWVTELSWILLARRCFLPSLIAPYTLQQLLCKIKFHLNPILSTQGRVWNWGFQKCLERERRGSWATSGLRNSSLLWGSSGVWRNKEGKKTNATKIPKLFYFSHIVVPPVTGWGLDKMIWVIPWFHWSRKSTLSIQVWDFLGNLFSRMSGMEFQRQLFDEDNAGIQNTPILGAIRYPCLYKKISILHFECRAGLKMLLLLQLLEKWHF